MRSILAAVLLAVPAAAAAPKAPNFKIARVLNAPVAKIGGLADLKGKVVFLEFWATWCGPCVAGIPRANRLIDALKGEPVVFLSVTDEPAETIAAFRKTHDMKAWIGIDEAGSSLKAFHVASRPAGYLIGKDGTLLASIYPDELQEQDVRDAIAGRFKPRPVVWEDAPRPKAAVAGRGKTYIEVRVSQASGEPSMSGGDDELEAQATDFAQNVAWIWDVPGGEVLVDSAPVSAFNFTLKTSPERFSRGREALKSAVLAAFGVVVAPEKRETEALVLALSDAPGAPRPKQGAMGPHSLPMESRDGRLLGTASMMNLAHDLWDTTDKPVVDETGLQGVYDFDLEWKRGDRTDLDRALATQGLVLVPARRTVEFLRVSLGKP